MCHFELFKSNGNRNKVDNVNEGIYEGHNTFGPFFFIIRGHSKDLFFIIVKKSVITFIGFYFIFILRAMNTTLITSN